MSTRKFIMPQAGRVGQATKDGAVYFDEAFRKYVGGLEDVSGRVADYVSGTPTTTQLRDALVAAGLMKAQ